MAQLKRLLTITLSIMVLIASLHLPVFADIGISEPPAVDTQAPSEGDEHALDSLDLRVDENDAGGAPAGLFTAQPEPEDEIEGDEIVAEAEGLQLLGGSEPLPESPSNVGLLDVGEPSGSDDDQLLGDGSGEDNGTPREGECPVIIVEAVNVVYDGDDHTVTVANLGEGDSIAYSIDDGDTWNADQPEYRNVGKYEFKIKVTNENCEDRFADAVVEITARPVIITVDNASKLFGEDDPTFTGSITEGNLVASDDLETITYVRTNTDEDVGTYPEILDAQYTNNDNYVVTVNKGDFEIKPQFAVTGVETVYDGNPHTVTVIGVDETAGDEVWYSSTGEDGSWSKDKPEFIDVKYDGVGQVAGYPVFVKVTNTASDDRFADTTVKINPREITITVYDSAKVFGKPDPTITGSITEGSLVDPDHLGTITYERTNTDEDIGVYPEVLDANYTENPNYIVAVNKGDFTIVKDTSRVILRHGGKIEEKLYPGEYYKHFIALDASGDGANIQGHSIVLEVDHDYLELGSFTTVPAVESYEFFTKNGKTYIIFALSDVAGGSSFGFEIPLKAKNRLTPESLKTDIKTYLIDSDGNPVSIINEVEEVDIYAYGESSFITKYDRPGLSKTIKNASLWGGLLDDDGETFIGEPEPYPYIRYGFSISHPTEKEYEEKRRAYEKMTIVDTLPEGAVFDPDENPGWTLSSDGKTVSYVIERAPEDTDRSFLSKVNDLSLYLKFPDTTIDTEHTNTVDILFDQEERANIEPDHTGKASRKHKFLGLNEAGIFKKGVSSSTMQDFPSAKIARKDWTLTLQNPTPYPIKDIVIEDYKSGGIGGLDERFYIEEIRIGNSNILPNIKAVYKYDADGNKVEVTRSSKSNSSYAYYEMGEDAYGFRIELDEIPPEHFGTSQIYIYSYLRDPENTHYNPNDPSENTFKNEAGYTGTLVPGDGNDPVDLDVTGGAEIRLNEVNERIRVEKALDGSYWESGDEIEFRLRILPSGLDPDRILPNLRLIDLLPLGLDPIEGEGYTVVDNFMGTGRFAYVYELGDVKASSLGSVKEIKAKMKVNDLIYIPTNRTNEVFLAYDGEQLPVTASGKTETDIWDLNHNDDIEDSIPYDSKDVRTLEKRSIISAKYINDNVNTVWGLSRRLNEGEPLNYRLSVLNNSVSDIKKLIIYDIFPYIDDVYIVENHDGAYLPRGSELENTLTGPVTTDLSGFTAYYLTVSPPQGAPTAVNVPGWTTSPGDYSAVKAIKVVMDSDVEFEQGQELNIYIPMKSPEKWVSDDYQGVNTFAISEDGGAIFNEANSVRNSVYQPVILKKVWVGNPAVKPPVKIQLYKNGVPYEDPVILDESNNWEYEWTGLERHGIEYTVDEVDLPANFEKEINGFVITNTYVKVDIEATKVWVGGPVAKPAIELQLYQNDEPYGEPVKLVDGQTTYTWIGLDKTDSEGNAYVYTVDEVDVPTNYEKDVDGFAITNTYVIPKIDIKVTKAWVGGPAEKPAIKVQLYKDGEAYGDPVELASGKTTHIWADLDQTDGDGNAYAYTVDELEVPDKYRKSINGFTITNTYVDPASTPPYTGDPFNLELWIGLAGVSLIGMLGTLGMIRYRKRKGVDR